MDIHTCTYKSTLYFFILHTELIHQLKPMSLSWKRWKDVETTKSLEMAQESACKGNLGVQIMLNLSLENLIRRVQRQVYYILVSVKIAFTVHDHWDDQEDMYIQT